MVVFEDGRPLKSAYRKFNIKTVEGQDDYGSMREVITRRFEEYFRRKDSGEGFGRLPDLILLDGGRGHVAAVRPVLESMGLGGIPLFGMVKDDKHRTRAIALDGGEISIHSHRAAFTLVGAIQEEVHRFAIGYHRQRRRKTMIGSSLLEIPGVGPTRAKALLRHFRTVTAIQNADLEELEAAPAMTKPAARACRKRFRRNILQRPGPDPLSGRNRNGYRISPHREAQNRSFYNTWHESEKRERLVVIDIFFVECLIRHCEHQYSLYEHQQTPYIA